jgi:hypothetical protein
MPRYAQLKVKLRERDIQVVEITVTTAGWEQQAVLFAY